MEAIVTYLVDMIGSFGYYNSALIQIEKHSIIMKK